MTVDRSRMPQLSPTEPVKFPHVAGHALSNGVRVRTVEHHDVPVVACLLLVEAGAANDPEDRPGLSAISADLADEGAGDRDAVAFHDALARIGAQFDTETGHDATLFTLVTLARHRDRALSLLADLAFRPRLQPADFSRVRDLRRNRVVQLRTVPNAVAERAFIERLFGAHPYGHVPLGTEAALGALTLDEVRAFHAAHYRPSAITVIVVGDASHGEMLASIERTFGDAVPRSESPSAPASRVNDPPAPESAARLVLVPRAGAPQSELRIGRVAAARGTPDYHPLVVLNTVLGGQFVSRINLNLREDKGYTYGARSGFEFRRGPGPFVVAAGVQTDATAAAVREVLGELDAIRGARPPDARELERAKAALTRGYARGFETAEQLARAVTQLVVYGLDDDYYDRFVERTEAVDAGAVLRAARSWLDPDRMTVVIVGDRTSTEAPLEALGLGNVSIQEA